MSRDVERARAARYAQEDNEARATARVVEPLLKFLVPGQHYFGPEQFEALAQYLLIDPLPVTAALSDGKFKLREMTLIRVTSMTANRMVTSSAMSKTTGIPRQTLDRMLGNSGLPCWRKGRQKLYNIEHVRSLLLKYRKEGE